MQELRRGRHTVSALHVHLVFVCKYRRGVLDAAALDWLGTYFDEVCTRMDCRLLASDGEDDHIHLLVEYPPKLSISVLVNALKGSSSQVLRRLRPDIAQRYWRGSLWSPSYFAASAGGAPLSVLKEYVENQRRGSSPP